MGGGDHTVSIGRSRQRAEEEKKSSKGDDLQIKKKIIISKLRVNKTSEEVVSLRK